MGAGCFAARDAAGRAWALRGVDALGPIDTVGVAATPVAPVASAAVFATSGALV